MFTRALFIGLALILSFASAVSAQECTGPGDITGDGVVGLEDVELFYGCMAGPGVSTPPPGCDPAVFELADLEEDFDVDLGDFTRLALLFQEAYFPYGPHRDNLEAEMLAMEITGQLRAPDFVYDRILRDLDLIRQHSPELVTVIDDPDYVPNELLVGVNESMPLDDYYATNEYYLYVAEEDHGFFRVLRFCDNLNAVVLASIYAALPAVDWADPNWFIGHDDRITVTLGDVVMGYEIDDGFWDCFDGCDCHRVWTFTVDEVGTVTLIDYQEWGQPWCEF